MSKTIRELADEFNVSKQAIRKQLNPKFRENYVQTVTSNGVKTLVVNNYGYKLIKQHFKGGNDQKLNEKTGTSNGGNQSNNTIELLKQQLLTKDGQIKEKDNQLRIMQKLLDQSQQLQLMTESKIKQLENKNNKSDTEDLSKEKPEPDKKRFWKNLFS